MNTKNLPQYLGYSSVDRRYFIRTASASLSLPALTAFGDSHAQKGFGESDQNGPRNFVAIGTYLGWHQNAFYPRETGLEFEIPATLKPVAEFRQHFTVFSGLDHRAGNGHNNWSNFLCGSQPGTYSFDQLIADQIGKQSRFASLQLTTGSGENRTGLGAMNFSRENIYLPMLRRPSVLYRQMFITREDRKRTEYLLKSGRSSLDHVVGEAKRLSASLPAADREKLAEYFHSVRSLEGRMGRQLRTLDNPAADPGYKLPENDPITPNLQMEASVIMYDLIAIALECGLTRVATLFLDGLGQVFTINGRPLSSGYHGLSHHGNDPAMIRDLVLLDTAHLECFAHFLRVLREKKGTRGKTLLDDTIVLLGTGMGDASRHSNRDLPTLVAGGGLAHKGHVALTGKQETLLGDLYITLAQRLGVEIDSFSNARGNMNEVLS
ncbi:MAG: DUF1552 domain-containing protein [Planctomycetota bacterium]|nr:DUF1552 domain-containing protein [Planctomycetota bacterium]